jgi:thymidylate synthase
MFTAIPTEPTCARAWVAAATAISGQVEAYNVLIDVDDPTKFDDRDNAVITLVDTFLRDRDLNPISTITNTIFPDSLYRKYGSPKFYGEYHTQVYDKLTTSKQWGRYFERLTRHQDGEGGTYNPLQETIDKLKTVKESDHQYKSVYELAVYDPLQDRRYLRGGQCLSFLSLKVHAERGLTMTAMYRNQTYVTRCLGNLVGLGMLQAFIAKEAGLGVGPLTCISTHAELDVGKGWGLTEARKLVSDAAALLKA